MLDWVKNIMNALGYPGVLLLMFLENVFPPIPSELVMPLAGFTATQGQLSLVGVIIAGTVGSVIGALPLYYIGRTVGEERLTRWADKHGHWLTVSGADIRRAKGWFERHGPITVFFCRLVPGVRSLISIPAGMASMNLPQFLLYSTLGAAIWTSLLAYGGYLLSERYDQIGAYLGPATYVVFGLLLAGSAYGIWKRRRRAAAEQ